MLTSTYKTLQFPTSQSTAPSTNSFILAQLKILSSATLDPPVLRLLTRLTVEYTFNYALSISLIAFPSCSAEVRQRATGLRIAYYANISIQAFKNLLHLVDATCEFVFRGLVGLEEETPTEEDDLDYEAVAESEVEGLWRRLSECLLEMKLFKNYQEHAQVCLRAKHTHVNCKAELGRAHSRHIGLTLVGGAAEGGRQGCVFAKVSTNCV
jgi:hypothetical protein